MRIETAKEIGEDIGQQIFAAVKGYVERSLAKRDSRLDALEAQQSTGRDGRLATDPETKAEPMTKGQKLGQEIFEAVKDYVGRSLASRDERIAALEAQQAKSLADAYRGAWGPNNLYTRGSLVNHRDSLWLCMSDTGEPPGSTKVWRLILKSPR